MREGLSYHLILSVAINSETKELVGINQLVASEIGLLKESVVYHGGADQFGDRVIELSKRALASLIGLVRES